MDKLKTKILLISLLLVLLFSAQSVAAATDGDGNLTSESIDLSICDNESDVNTENVLEATNKDVLTYTGSFSELQSLIDRHYDGWISLDYGYKRGEGESAITIQYPIKIYGNHNTIDGNQGEIFKVTGINVVIEDVVFTNGNSGNGSAIEWTGHYGQLTDCDFNNNIATDNGGAIYWTGQYGQLTDCEFNNNIANNNGGAVYFQNNGTVTNCNFTNNTATNGRGDAVYFQNNGTVTNCNFTNNTATNGRGGAVYFGDNGAVEKCNFINNKATGSGGAVFFMIRGIVTNCNFINNKATGSIMSLGGAVFFMIRGIVTNCNFINNKATNGSGGAVFFMTDGEVTNCNFTNNTANDSGAIFMNNNGEVTNCNFTNNTATNGDCGAIFMVSGTVENCNFADNKASNQGGAVYFYDVGNVTNCNFTGNNAADGSAIYYYFNAATKTVSNSIFLNNRANAETLEVTKKDNNITITFTGNDNLLNAIYSRDNAEVTFTNVTYWGANGIANTGSSVIKPSRSNKESGQNITLEIYDYDDSLVENVTLVTDDNGQVTYDLSKLSNIKYRYKTYHLEDSYYTYAEKNGTITLERDLGDFNILQSLINWADANSVLTLDRNYTFTIGLDENLADGIVIDKPITINGNGYTINALQKARIFNVTAANVVLNNITFTNATASGNGGAVYFSSSGSVTNCNFTNNTAKSQGGAIRFSSTGTVKNCNFADNSANNYGGAIYFSSSGTIHEVRNCNFTDNKATGDKSYGGAVFFMTRGIVTNCNFINNKATGSIVSWGGAILFAGAGNVTNCNFTNNSASDWGGAILFAGTGNVTNCSFTNNAATNGYAGAVYFENNGTVTNCNFTNNKADGYGGAVYFYRYAEVINSNFTGNNAAIGSAIYFYSTSDNKTVSNSIFLNNRANAEALEVTINDKNITIAFKGKDNLLNAIYSRNDAEVTFTNVTYWSANGINKTGNSAIKPSRSKNEAGQNITVGVVVNDEIVLSGVYLTDENGMIVLDISAGDNYYISVRHDTDSYYTEAEKTISNNTKFSVNVTSQTTNNRTVNITAKSNIPNEVIGGKLLFILPNSTEISANYGGNGTWWAVHTFDDCGVYEINASYTGLDNVTVNNGTVTISKANSTIGAENKTVIYPSDIVLVTSGENCTGINKSSVVIRNPDGTTADANVNVDGFTIIISGLGAGNYTVYYNNTVNSDCNGAGNFTGITVLKANSSVSAGDVEVTYGEAIDVIVTSENATGVSYKVIGKEGIVKEGTVNVGENISGLDLATGDYTVNLTTIVNANYTSSNFTSKITVKPANSTVKAEDVEVTYGDSIVVAITSENATKVSYQVIGADGVVDEGIVNVGESITGLDLAAGDYTVNLTTIVNGNYTSSNFTSKITVNPANSSVKAEDVEVTYGDSIVVAITSENATGVSYKVIGKEGIVKEGTVNVGENISGLDLAAGDYTVNLTAMVNANYTSSNFTSKITVNPANSTVKAEDVEVTYGDSIVVAITSENATKVSYQVIGADGVVDEGIVNVGESITGLDLAADNYTVNLTTIVDANYTSANYTSKITVNPASSSVSAEDVEVTYGEAIVIPVSVANAVALYYDVVDENNNIVVSDIIPAGSNITVNDLAAGSYNVTLITGVDLNHTSVRNASKITVNRAGSSVSAENVTVNYGEAISIPVSSANATEISYTITDANDNAVANGTVKPGEAINVPDLVAGDYAVSLTTVVDENHTSVSNSSKLHIRHVVTIIIAPVTGYVGEVVNFTAQFQYENGDSVNEGTASLTIKYEKREVLSASMYSILSADGSVPVSNGKATFNVKLGKLGKYPYVVSYSGSDVDDAQAESTLTILKADTTVSCSNVSGKPADKKNVTVTLLDQDNNPVANGTVTLTLNGKTYNSTVENGTAVLSIELPNPGSYNATVAYDGNDYYNSSTSSISVDVEKVNTNAPSAEDVSGKAGEKTNITVKFVDEYGNPVKNGTATLTVDGKIYTAEVVNGTATFKDVVLPNKDTVADVYYQGNDYYNASSATFSIKVKQNNTDENKTTKHVSSEIADGNTTGNPIAMMLLALCALVITYRKK